MRTHLTVAFVMLCVGGAGGYLLAPRSGSPPSGAPLAHGEAAPRGLTAADVQRAIREELAALPAAAADAAAGAAAAAPAPVSQDERAPPLSPAAATALLDAHERIDRAIAAKEWTKRDAAVLTAALEVLPAAQHEELLRSLIPALNRGEVRLTYQGPLFE